MPGLIQKSGYIKPGNGGGHYAEYIATREGVELIEAPPPSHDGGGYLEYMAERPRSHGLFSADGPADLENTMEEINGHTGPVWTFVYSLKREDAHRLGYENSESWRRLLLAHQTELAQAMKISPSSFRWRAAFHDEKHHPHIHMMVWSADPKQGFLTEKGIEKMRSQLSNEIFRDELLSLYQKKDLSYSQVRDAAMEAMGRLIREMETGLCHSPVIMEQMETLAGMLENHKGKKVYGYLKKPAKAQVDAIRSRVGMPALPENLSQAEMILRVRHERMVELCYEECRYFDVRRWAEAFNSSELYQKYFKIPCEKLTAMRITRTKNPDDTYSYTYERRVDDLKNASTQARDVLLPIPENEANNLYSLTNVRWQNSGW